MQTEKGKLYLIPTPLKESGNLADFQSPIPELLHSINTFIVEDEKQARRHFKQAGLSGDFDRFTYHILNEHSKVEDTVHYLDTADAGENIGLLSDAGLPCVADPGSLVVRQAHQRNIKVVPLPGPSSLMLALMASGFNGQNFAFNGYLPIEKNKRIQRIRELEKKAWNEHQTQLFMETPYRNVQLAECVIQTCRADTCFCLALDLTLPSQEIISKEIRAWRDHPLPTLNKRPAIFLLFH